MEKGIKLHYLQIATLEDGIKSHSQRIPLEKNIQSHYIGYILCFKKNEELEKFFHRI